LCSINRQLVSGGFVTWQPLPSPNIGSNPWSGCKRFANARDLQMQIGLNSGAITAAMLYHEKGHLQLFGDMVNTVAQMEAAWMEANCTWNPIYVMQSMADCLVTGSKGHWIKAWNDIIEAKGKGSNQAAAKKIIIIIR